MNLSPGTNTRSYRMTIQPYSSITHKPHRIESVTVTDITPQTKTLTYSNNFIPRNTTEIVLTFILCGIGFLGMILSFIGIFTGICLYLLNKGIGIRQ